MSGTRDAIKRLELDGAQGAGAGWLSMADPWQMRTDMADQMRTEMEVLSQVQHVNIVPLLGWSKDGRAPCLVYTFMEGDSLQERAIHRDVKSASVLLDRGCL